MENSTYLSAAPLRTDRLPQSASLKRLPRAHMIEESNPIPFHGAQRFSPSLMEGLKHHGGGRLLEAALCYQSVLNPAGDTATPDPDALLLLGIVARQSRYFPQAIQLTRAAVEQRPSAVHYMVNLAHSYRCAGEFSEAERWYRSVIARDPLHMRARCWMGEALLECGKHQAAHECYREALGLQPNHGHLHHGLGNVLAKEKRYAEAAASYRRAIECLPAQAEFHFGLGYALGRLGNLPQARRAFNDALQLRPHFPEAHLNLGNLYYDHGNFGVAAASYRRALLDRPGYAKAATNLGNALVKLNRIADAIHCYRHALALEPQSAIVQHALGNALTTAKDWAPAEKCLHKALELDPANAEIHNSLGNLFYSQKQMHSAAARYRQAMELDADYAKAHVNLGNAVLALGDLKEARACYQRGLALDPESPGAIYNMSLAHLRAGEYAAGWKGYEARWSFEELHLRQRLFPQARWIGQPLAGKTILLHAEQGLGDTLQFVRYAPLVAARGARIILEVRPPLERLLRGLPGVSEVLARGAKLPGFDYHSPLMSLPAVFETEPATIPTPEGYLHVPETEIEAAYAAYPGEGLRVGIAWAGNPKHKADATRSLPLRAFLPLAEIPGLTLFSLQKGPATGQLAALRESLPIQDTPAAHADFYQTALMMSTLDLVISVDTSVAHLAGAIGKPFWVLLSRVADWRWMETREDSPWYRSATLFRQTAPGDWHGVIERIVGELRRVSHPTAIRT
jgi:tetratricopeptide (TPR) repeat protein